MESQSRVLVIDDEPLIRRAFARMLRGTCQVVFAASAAEALAMIGDGDVFDAIVCDLHLGGGIDGWEFYERLLARSIDLASRMIMTSGSAPSGENEAFGHPLAERWLMKPIATPDLIGLIERVAVRLQRAG